MGPRFFKRALLLWAALAFLPCLATAQAQPPTGALVLTQLGATGGGGWVAAYPDTIFVSSASIVSATTTLLLTGSAGTGTSQQAIYVFFAGVQATGTNSSNTFNFEMGQGATCGTNTVAFEPVALTAPTASPNLSNEIGGASIQNAVGAIAPADSPLVIPSGYNLCLVTAGTTTSLKAIVAYAQHA